MSSAGLAPPEVLEFTEEETHAFNGLCADVLSGLNGEDVGAPVPVLRRRLLRLLTTTTPKKLLRPKADGWEDSDEPPP